jgi:hypothetical protein
MEFQHYHGKFLFQLRILGAFYGHKERFSSSMILYRTLLQVLDCVATYAWLLPKFGWKIDPLLFSGKTGKLYQMCNMCRVKLESKGVEKMT